MSGTLMLNGTNYTATGNLILGGGGSDANINIASEYDSTATYAYGAYCIKDGVLYRCTTAISVAEAWNSAHWSAVMVTGEYKRVRIMTQAQFDLLSNDEKDGFIYVPDYPTKIQDIDNVTLTTSDNNKLLGVSVSGSDISVGAVDLTPIDFSSQINWKTGVTVLIIAAYRVLNMCIISVAIRASGLVGELAVLPHIPNAKYFGRIQDNNGGNAQVPYITVYEENGVGKLAVDVAVSGTGLLIGEIVYFIN